ncbi:MAG: histidinol-phosphate transaminase [Betaproteobacteria bacterium]|nr:histidinol-phosphate transaminase [Betaproteobacteria bacterium]
MNLTDLAPEYIRSIAPYQPGKPISDVARELGMEEADIIKLASNENPLGPSPKAIEAIKKALNDLALYPDGSGFALKEVICRKFGVRPEQIILGNGSNDVLELAARTFLAPGTSAVYSQHAFAVYPLATQAVGATGIEVAAMEFGNDLDAMLAAIRTDTRIVFLANPNNPTGTFVVADKLHAFLKRVPANVLVVLDEAYTEYLDATLAYNSVPWLKEFPNLIISRTLSKAYGLAGLRVGFGLANENLIALMNRVRQPFNVNHLAMVAATAALDDDEFIARSRQVNSDGIAYLGAELSRRGIAVIPPYGNFITFRVGSGEVDTNANAVFHALLKQGVIVRPIAGYGMPDWLRVTIGTRAQNDRFLTALDQATRKAA